MAEPTEVRFPFALRHSGREVSVSAVLGWLLLEGEGYTLRVRLAGVGGLEVAVLRPWWALVLAALLAVAAVLGYVSGFFGAVAPPVLQPLGWALIAGGVGLLFLIYFALSATSVMRLWLESGQFVVLAGAPKKVAQLEEFLWQYAQTAGRKGP